MKAGLYFGLAKEGIRKNARLYVPYLLTCIGMVMMYYILIFLQKNDTIKTFKGGENAQLCLGLGGWVIAIFACIFLFYTNSFLLRRRKKEFGLYHILGMGRRHIGYVLLWENVMVTAISLGFGIVAGILFSKLAELGMINILKVKADFSFSVSLVAVKMTVCVFLVIFVLLFFNALRQIQFSTAISLLGSEKEGEKPPKGNWMIALLGLVVIITAYAMAVSIENPINALSLFFVAVVMVIVATYLLMIAGSVFFCKLLMKNKKYYYNKKHFVSVSSMVYRMKRNGAGLASICILATMVLVMISSSSCLYFGSEDALKAHYPREINVMVSFKDASGLADENVNRIITESEESAKKLGCAVQNAYSSRCAVIYGALENNEMMTKIPEDQENALVASGSVRAVMFFSIADYNKMTGENIMLKEDEILLYTPKNDYSYDTLCFLEANEFKIKEKLTECVFDNEAMNDVVEVMYIFVADFASSLREIDQLSYDDGKKLLQYSMEYGFDTGKNTEEQIAFYQQFTNKLGQKSDIIYDRLRVESRAVNREDFFATFGGLFYLGILLSIVFILAAALIIYYKQISEGYEDQMRFEIMQKVGMTHKEIRQSINSQMLTVFFFPLFMAGLHVCFAFPMIRKLLTLFSLYNVSLFVTTSIISFLIFALLYMIVYRITSNAYFHIVSK